MAPGEGIITGYLLTTGRQPGESKRATGKMFQLGADKNDANRATGKNGEPGANQEFPGSPVSGVSRVNRHEVMEINLATC